MTRLVHLSLRYRTVTLLLVALLAVGGVASVTSLNRELFPAFDVPYLVVTASQPGAGPSEIADDLARPIEGALEGSGGIEHVRSTSLEGFSIVVGEYEFGTDMETRQREVRDALAAARLPEGVAAPTVERISPDSFPIYSVAVAADDEAALESFVSDELVPALRAVDGVGEVSTSGGSAPVVAATVDPEAVAAAGLSLRQVTAALESAQVSIPVGGVSAGSNRLPVRVATGADSVDGLAAVSIGTSPAGEVVTLGEVADVALSESGSGQTISRLDGDPAITVEVIKAQSGNTVEAVEGLQDAIEQLEPPTGIAVAEVVNQAPEINRAVSELARDALLGVVLAVLVILAFLRTVRGTLVAAVSIPLSLLIGFILMGTQGITLNILTLGALSVAAARVIDDSIVVLENIHRLLEEGVERGEAVVRGTSQMVPAITASTITTVAVFLPLAFVDGIVGEVFVGFALTITFALLASLLVAVTVVPVLAQTFLRLSDDRKGDAAEQALASRYRRPLAWALDHRAVVVIAAVALLIGSMTAARSIPTNLFPSLQAEVLQVDIALPPGTSLAATSEAVAGLESEVAAIAGIEQYTTVVGTSPDAASSVIGGGGSGSNSARLTIDLADGADTGRVETALDAALETTALRGTVTEAAGAGPGDSQLTVQVTGREFTAVADGAAEVAAALQTIEGLEAITSNVASARPELVAEVDAEAAAARGLDGTEVAGLLRAALNPTPATTVRVDGEELQVVVAVDPSAVAAPDDLAALPLAPGVNLGDVASLRQGESPTGVTTLDGSRSAEVSATIVSNNIGAVTTDVENALDQLDLAGAEASLGGASEMMRDSFSSLLVAMLIAVALVYLAMVAAFGSLLTPFVILLSLPLAAVGALPALLVTGRELGLPAMIGLLMLIGIVVTNAIVMLEFVERLKREGLPTRDALLVGAQTRLRPILMTAIVTVTALVPLALGLSEGAVLSSSLATVVIGGMLSATLLTLFVVPVAYSLVDGLRRRTGGGVAAPAADRPDPMLVGT